MLYCRAASEWSLPLKIHFINLTKAQELDQLHKWYKLFHTPKEQKQNLSVKRSQSWSLQIYFAQYAGLIENWQQYNKNKYTNGIFF